MNKIQEQIYREIENAKGRKYHFVPDPDNFRILIYDSESDYETSKNTGQPLAIGVIELEDDNYPNPMIAVDIKNTPMHYVILHDFSLEDIKKLFGLVKWEVSSKWMKEK